MVVQTGPKSLGIQWDTHLNDQSNFVCGRPSHDFGDFDWVFDHDPQVQTIGPALLGTLAETSDWIQSSSEHHKQQQVADNYQHYIGDWLLSVRADPDKDASAVVGQDHVGWTQGEVQDNRYHLYTMEVLSAVHHPEVGLEELGTGAVE